MNDTILSRLNPEQNSLLPLIPDVRHQSETLDEKTAFAIVLIFLRNLLRDTLSRDKVKIAEYSTRRQCEDLGLSKEQVEDALERILETGELLRQSHPLSGMF